jgi:hypothetical protein
MDIQMEALLEEMQVNWSIIKSALLQDKQEIDTNEQSGAVKGKFEHPEHIEDDKLIKHYIKQEAGVSNHIVETALNTRKKLAGLDPF